MSREKRSFSHHEVACLITVVAGEFERRLQVTQATADRLGPSMVAERLHRASI